MTPELLKCPSCGNSMPAAAPEGLCPACSRASAKTSPAAAFSTESGRAADAASDAHPVENFGNYEILDGAGLAGGMGVVHQARQKSPSRIVALKMIRAGCFATEEEVR